MKEKSNSKIGTFTLTCYGIGNCVGSGIFISMGTSIGYAGKSVVPCIILASFIVWFAYWYKIVMSGTFVLPGGRYAQQALLQPKYLVGYSAVVLIFAGLSVAMYGIAIVEYASIVFPAIEPYQNLIAWAIITIFFITTMLGGKFMASFNAIMVVVLMCSLIAYIASGIPQVDFSSISLSSGDYFDSGIVGFIMGAAVLSFACQGATMPIDMGENAKSPKKSLPKAILFATLIVMVFYVLIAVVTTGVLPIEEVADQSLGTVAKSIFSYPIFVVFVLGGACFAIATSLYTVVVSMRYPLMQAVKDGWFPEFWGKTTKKGYPFRIMALMYVISLVPLIVGTSVSSLVSWIMIPTMVINTINNLLLPKLLKKYPNLWKKSTFHMPKPLFIASVIFAAFCSAFLTLALLVSMSTSEMIAMVVGVGLVFVYVVYRIKTGKVDLTEFEQAKLETEKIAEEENQTA